jgi:hypothetical protein
MDSTVHVAWYEAGLAGDLNLSNILFKDECRLYGSGKIQIQEHKWRRAEQDILSLVARECYFLCKARQWHNPLKLTLWSFGPYMVANCNWWFIQSK